MGGPMRALRHNRTALRTNGRELPMHRAADLSLLRSGAEPRNARERVAGVRSIRNGIFAFGRKGKGGLRQFLLATIGELGHVQILGGGQ